MFPQASDFHKNTYNSHHSANLFLKSIHIVPDYKMALNKKVYYNKLG